MMAKADTVRPLVMMSLQVMKERQETRIALIYVIQNEKAYKR
jgi:hypothetical protein